MSDHKKVVLIEFNELSPVLLDRWMGEGKLPNFKKFYDQSAVHVSEPDVESSEFLEPWIQWYSMHVGLKYEEHKVFHLTDGAKANDLDIWSHLKNNGKKVASFASMNAKGFDGEGNFFLPDPWCNEADVFPKELDIYQRFISSSVQEYTNENKGFTLGDYVKFLSFMLKRGLTFSTILKIVKQLATEKLIDKNAYWKRVALLDRMQMDLFKSYYKAGNFDFTTFFANSTAHLQHAYWRYMEPEAFETKPSEEELSIYKDAVFFGYESMDTLLGEAMDLVDDETLLVLASALSQQPFLKKEGQGGQNFYRPHDVEKLLGAMDIKPEETLPTMTHQFMLRFKDELETQKAKQKLSAWSCNGGQPVFDINDRGQSDSIYFGNRISELVDSDCEINDEYNNKKVKFSKYFYRINETKSGCHHPDGILWFKTGEHKVHNEKVSILDVFPTVSELLGVSIPVNVEGRGKSLARDLS